MPFSSERQGRIRVIEGVGSGATGVVDGVEHLFRGQLGEAVDDIGHGLEGLSGELVTGGWEFAVGHLAAIAELVEGAARPDHHRE